MNLKRANFYRVKRLQIFTILATKDWQRTTSQLKVTLRALGPSFKSSRAILPDVYYRGEKSNVSISRLKVLLLVFFLFRCNCENLYFTNVFILSPLSDIPSVN